MPFCGGKQVKDVEYTDAFRAHMRKGDISASMSKGSAPDGGYLTPVEWDRTITDKLILVSPMRSIARVQSISTVGYTKLFNLHGTSSGWVGETAARPNTNTPQLAPVTYTCPTLPPAANRAVPAPVRSTFGACGVGLAPESGFDELPVHAPSKRAPASTSAMGTRLVIIGAGG